VTGLATIATLSFVMSATPGPNNVLFAASGPRAGYVGTLPDLVGMLAGLAGIVAACAAGVGQLVLRAPHANVAMTLLASAYLAVAGTPVVDSRCPSRRWRGRRRRGSDVVAPGAATAGQPQDFVGVRGVRVWLPHRR
jgi:threonine/homoserine/homoserine lactone efflux protein